MRKNIILKPPTKPKMDSTLQNHGAKYNCRIPDGLRELCNDISREVLRCQPLQIYNFIADYVEALLLTRENAKVATKLVDKIMADSESIVNFLNRCGLNLGQIAAIAPKLQEAFHDYLNYTDCNCALESVCVDDVCNEDSKLSVKNIIEATGVTLEEAERAACVIQRAFLKHYKTIINHETNEEPPWKSALTKTIEILKNSGLSERDAKKTAKFIESTYHEYYTRRNRKKSDDMVKNAVEAKKNGFPKPDESIQAVAWLNMMYDDSTRISEEKANQAATIIQRTFREYRSRKASTGLERSASTSTMVARAILENLDQRIFDNKVVSREAIPREFGTIQEIAKATEKLPQAYKERLDGSKLSLNTAISGNSEDGESGVIAEDNEHIDH